MADEEGKPYSELEPIIQKLVDEAVRIKANAYCPYSNFRVGAAVLAPDDKIISGCNVENAAYSIACCAERVALQKAASIGYRKFKALAVSCDIMGKFVGPCGCCRQFCAEFGTNWDVYLVRPDMTWKRITVGELLPFGFGPQTLEDYNKQ